MSTKTTTMLMEGDDDDHDDNDDINEDYDDADDDDDNDALRGKRWCTTI